MRNLRSTTPPYLACEPRGARELWGGYINVNDARKNELELAGVGECINALLFTPLLSQSYTRSSTTYLRMGESDGKMTIRQVIHIDAADNDHRNIRLNVYDGKDHFNALISEAAVEKAAT